MASFEEDRVMSEQPRDIPWIDSNLFTENFNKFPHEELLKYAGQYTGWSLDGTRILASGADELAMEQHLKELGIDPSRVVGMYIPTPEESALL
jgi:hypothetical protein